MKKRRDQESSAASEKKYRIPNIPILTSDLSPTPAYGFFYLVVLIMQVDLTINIYLRWHTVISRLLTLKEFLLSWCGLLGYLASNDSKNMLQNVHNHYEKYKNGENDNFTNEHVEILKERDKQILKYNKVIIFMLKYILHIMCGLVPYVFILISIYKCYKKGENYGKIPEIIHSYFPKAFKNSMLFQLVYHTSIYVWYSMLLYNWSIITRSMLFNFICLDTEIKLLSLTLKEIGEWRGEGRRKLEERLRKIVQQHQSICRGLMDLEKNSSKVVFGFVNLYGSQICIYLIFITLIDDLHTKVRYVSRYLITFTFVYFTCDSGQTITDLGRKLRVAFYDCSWVDKPYWFRRTIFFMITRASREMVVRPFRLYVLDIGCIVWIVKGTYTYLNFAKKLVD